MRSFTIQFEDKKDPSREVRMFSVPLRMVAANLPLPCNMYILLAEQPVCLRKVGDTFTSKRLKELNRNNVTYFYIPIEEREAYRRFLWGLIGDSSASMETRANAMTGAAHLETESIYSGEDPRKAFPAMAQLMEHGHLAIEGAQKLSQLIPTALHEELAHQHAVNTSVYCMALARLAYKNDEKKVSLAGLAGLLHDVGESKVPQRIRDNSDRDLLPQKDWEELKKHTKFGIDVLEGVLGVPPEIRSAIAQHHEHFDGTGYPNNLKGDQIDPIARLVSICDIFDVLTTTMPHKEPLSPIEALKLMQAMQPGRFDPVLFSHFTKNL